MTVRKIGETSVHSPLKRVALLILAVVFFVSATAFAVPPVMYNVTIYDGSSVTEVLTSKNTADEILADEGIEINEEKADEVSLANFDGKDGSAIIIRRGVEVTIESFDGSKNTVYALGTVKDALKKAEIKLKKGTALNYSADTLLEDGMTIEIYDIYKIKGNRLSRQLPLLIFQLNQCLEEFCESWVNGYTKDFIACFTIVLTFLSFGIVVNNTSVTVTSS